MTIVRMMIALYGKNVDIHGLTDARDNTVAINCIFSILLLYRRKIEMLLQRNSESLKFQGDRKHNFNTIMAKKKETYSVGDYIVFKTIFGFNEGVVVEVIDESAVSVNTIDGFDNYYVPVRDIDFKTPEIK